MEINQKHLDFQSQKTGQLDNRVGIPWNADTMSTLTDFYQITMGYAYFRAKKHMENSVFEVFFRESPFNGTYTILAGVDDVLRFINTFRFGPEQIDFLKLIMPDCDVEFFEWLSTIDGSSVTIHCKE